MSHIIINEYVFSQLQNDLVQLGSSLNHISIMVVQIPNGLADDHIRERIEEEASGISSLCRCLSTMAFGMSENADNLRYWAFKENINIDYRK